MITHSARMNDKKALRAALEPGIATVLPPLNEAKAWKDMNRKARRRSISIMQGSQRDPKTGRITKRSLRKHSAAVQYRRGVDRFGVCPTQPLPETPDKIETAQIEAAYNG